jgi:hypothetical protein
MRQTTRPESNDHFSRLISVITDDKPAEQRAVIGRKRLCRAFDRTSNPIRRTINGAAFINITRPVELEFSDDVLPGNSAGTLGIERQTRAADSDPLTTTPGANTELLRPTTRPHFKSLTPDIGDHTSARRIRLGVVNEPNPSGEGSEHVGFKPMARVCRSQ